MKIDIINELNIAIDVDLPHYFSTMDLKGQFRSINQILSSVTTVFGHSISLIISAYEKNAS